jgi:hypothetical protein
MEKYEEIELQAYTNQYSTAAIILPIFLAAQIWIPETT